MAQALKFMIFIDFHWCSWISIGPGSKTHRFSLISSDFLGYHGFLRISSIFIDFHGFPWPRP
jgi:hypothetical protein